jgi:protein-disulfide isomerase
VIVEFSDFQCPFCKRFYDETYQQLLAAYPGKIRFVYRHLPLTSIHPEAFPAAEASMCANAQNAFSEYHDKVFENQDKLGRELYTQIASDLNLDTVAFEDCLNTGKYKDLVQQDSDFALNLGVQSTPTFFINGLALVGAQPLSAFTQLIDKELAGEIPK